MNSGGQGSRPKKTRGAAMPSSNNNSRYRGKEPRSSQGRPPLEASGVYADPKYAHALSSVIGCNVQVLTTAQQRFEGVLVSVSSENDAALGMVNPINEADPKHIDPAEVKEKLIFKPDKIVAMTVRNVDLDYAAKSGFQTDGAIQAKTNGGPTPPKELQPWVADDAPAEHLVTLESANGWDARDMFKLNERKYGVRSTYDQSLQGYTTPLEQTSRDQEAHAARLADEIERSSTSRHRADMENGDEEAAFAAVVRPGGDRAERNDRGDRGDRDKADRGGDRNDRGERNDRGDRGERAGERNDRGGERNDRGGERNDRGGERNDRGDRGERNDRGDRGERGEPYVPPARRQPSREPPPQGARGGGGPRGPPPAGRPPRGGGPQGMGGRGPPQHHGGRGGGGGRPPHPRASPPAHLQPPQHHGRVNGDGGERGSPPTPAGPSPPPARGASKSPATEQERPRARTPEQRGPQAEPPRRAQEPRGNGDVRNDARPDVRNGGPEAPRPGRDDVRVSGGGDARGPRPSGDVRASDDVRQQQRQQNGKPGIDSLKNFKQNFVLSEESAQRRDEPAGGAAGAQRTPPPAGPAAAQKQDGQTGGPAQTPENKTEQDNKPAAGSKSKLNPNAKAFTPSQPSSLTHVGYSPSPTPPRVVTPMAAMQQHHQQHQHQQHHHQHQQHAGGGGPYPSLMPAGYPTPVIAAGEYPPMGGVPHRAEAATPMQVAAVTGQPLMAPSPMGGHPSGHHPHQHHLHHPQHHHMPMALPQPGLMQTAGPGGYPQVVRMVYPPMYGTPGHQQAYEAAAAAAAAAQQQQQGGPPPGAGGPHHQLYGMVPQPGPGPQQPPTPGPQPGPGGGPGLMYAGAGGGPGGPAGPTSVYLVSAGQQMHHFALMHQQQAGGGQLSCGPMTSSVTSAVMSLGQQPYYIPAQQHPGQPYGPTGGVPMPLVPSHQ